MKRNRAIAAVIALLMCTAPTFAQIPVLMPEAVNRLEDLKGKTVMIRGFYGGPILHYDSKGSLLEGGPPESWTLAGLKIKGLKRHHDRLEIRGTRIGLLYNGKQFEAIERQEITPFSPVKTGSTIITVDVSSSEDATSLIRRIFLNKDDRLEDLVPDYWRSFVAKLGMGDERAATAKEKTPVATNPATEQAQAVPAKKAEQDAAQRTNEMGVPVSAALPSKVFKVGGAVSAPKAVFDPDPDYVEAARAAKIQGTTTLWVVVGNDGSVRDIRITKPAGFGMDDNAVAAVKTWHFIPAMKDGQPVTVQVSIDVNFRLF